MRARLHATFACRKLQASDLIGFSVHHAAAFALPRDRVRGVENGTDGRRMGMRPCIPWE